MTSFRRGLPAAPTFTQRGLKGYQFRLDLAGIEMYSVDVEQGHDDFVCSHTITHVYYVLDGSGSFTVNDELHPVSKGDLIEVPPGNNFAYAGSMKLLLLMSPPFSPGAVETVKPNPEVA